MEDTISINHNWFNAANLNAVFEALIKAKEDTEREISDCKNTCDSDLEWNEMSENLLKAHHGMNLSDFADILQFITQQRLQSLKSDKPFVFDGVRQDKSQLQFDLTVLKQFMETHNETFSSETKETLKSCLHEIKEYCI